LINQNNQTERRLLREKYVDKQLINPGYKLLTTVKSNKINLTVLKIMDK